MKALIKILAVISVVISSPVFAHVNLEKVRLRIMQC